uniref:guanine nucleotide-binding protein G(t) subunit alpha-3-like n=1 Tax=Styela clava TaxID=7725 RepID=UPI0019397681|nr:guanine nucleotide-binding protein G(t) subunit alpha-3-like [Styela clava]
MIRRQTYRRWEKLENRKSVKLDATNSDVIKIPILGEAGSGKTEVARALRGIYGKNIGRFDDEEHTMDVIPYKTLVRSNAIKTMRSLLREVEMSGFVYACENRILEEIKSYTPDLWESDIPNTIWGGYKIVWNEPGFVYCAKQIDNMDLFENAEYYFNNIDRLRANTYIPSPYDVILCRKQLNSILETPLRKNLWLLEVAPIDKKSNVKRILQFFERDCVLIFCVDVSTYDTFKEDRKTNRLLSTFEQFKWIANHEFTKGLTIMVLFTKKETFERKLLDKNLNICFNDYNGQNDFQSASEFVAKKFETVLQKNHCFYSSFVSCDGSNLAKDMKRVKVALHTCFVQLHISQMRL